MTPTEPVEIPSEDAVMTIPATDGPLSILGHLRERHDALVQENVLTLAVPRWDNPTLRVKYGPIDLNDLKAISKRAVAGMKGGANRDPDVELNANIDCLVKSCIAVVAVLEDDNEYSLRPDDPHGEPTRFDPDLAEALGLDRTAGARAVVRELFLTDGDIIQHATRLGDWSGFAVDQASQDLLGE